MKMWTLLLALPLSMTAAAEPSYGGYSGHGGMTAYDIAPNVYEYHYDHGFTGEDAMGWKPELQFIWSRFGAAEACGLPYDSEAALAALQQKYGHDPSYTKSMASVFMPHKLKPMQISAHRNGCSNLNVNCPKLIVD